MEARKPEVSLIIPLYNAENYIKQLVESIKVQSFEDFEALIVNDGSLDNGYTVCAELISGDDRFKLLNKENGGASSARNFGLDYCNGNWIAFMDADDIIGKDYLQALYNERVQNGIVVAGFYEKIGETISVSVDYPHGMYSRENGQVERLFEDNILFRHPSPVAKMFDASIVQQNNIRFNGDIQFGEDLLFWYECLLRSESINIIAPIDYCYLKDNSTLTKRKHRFVSDFELCNGVNHIFNQVKFQDSNKENKRIDSFLAILAVNALTAIRNERLTLKERYINVMKVWKSYKNLISRSYIPPTKVLKLKVKTFTYFPWLYTLLYC